MKVPRPKCWWMLVHTNGTIIGMHQTLELAVKAKVSMPGCMLIALKVDEEAMEEMYDAQDRLKLQEMLEEENLRARRGW